MKRKILIAGLLCLALLAAGCGNGSAAADGSLTESDVTTVKTDDGSYTVDKSAVLAEGKIDGDKKKIMDAVESYVLLFSRAYNGSVSIVDGDRIADSESALEHECDSRAVVLTALGQQDDTRHDGFLPHTITYELLDIQDGAARVIVNYEPRKGMEPWREGYIFTQEGRDWQLVNVIVNYNGGGDAVLDNLAASDDPAEWTTTYSYSQLPRSAYDGLHEYSDYIVDDQSGIGTAIEGSGKAVDLESLKYEDAIAEYNRTENK